MESSNREVSIGGNTGIAPGNEMFFDVAQFEQAYRVAKMFSTSSFVPDNFRNNVGNCMVGLSFAARIGLDPLMVFQKIYLVHGKMGIEGQLAIALINKSGKFSPLRFRFEGEGDNESCTAYATSKEDGEVCSQAVTWDMVKKEGWNKKAGSKWITLRSLMFQYRSAAIFGRLYCPEALMGMQTSDELHDVHDSVVRVEVSDANDALRVSHKPGPDDSIDEPLQIEEKTETLNPLHQTAAWKKYSDARDIDPVFAATMPEPETEGQCEEAATLIGKNIDQNLA